MGDVLDFDGKRNYGETERAWPWQTKPPFGKGNNMAAQHGLGDLHRNLVTPTVADAAEAIQAELLVRFEFLGDPLFQPAVERYVRVAARAAILNDWVDRVIAGETRAHPRFKGAPTTGVEAISDTVWKALNQAEVAAQRFAQDCGLDPIGFARIAKELGWAKSLAAGKVGDLAAKGRELRRGSGA